MWGQNAAISRANDAPGPEPASRVSVALEAAAVQEVADRQHPVQMIDQLRVPEAAGIAGDGRRDDFVALRQTVEEGRPFGQAAMTGQEGERAARPLPPDAAGLAVDIHMIDGRGRGSHVHSLSRPYSAATARCAMGSGAARSAAAIGVGHQWFSHSLQTSWSCGITCSA